MKFWQHGITSTIMAGMYIFLVMWLDTAEVGPLTLISLFSFGLPDLDKKAETKTPINQKPTSKHRHWFWHSSAIPMLSFLLGFLHMNFDGVGVFCVVVGTHLLCDYKFGKDGKSGFYLIWKRKGDRMSRANTDRYLLGNGFVCYLVAVLILFMRNI